MREGGDLGIGTRVSTDPAVYSDNRMLYSLPRRERSSFRPAT